jgi:DNA polymerase IV
MCGQIAEYLKRGTIAEVENTKASERFRALSLFASVYGIGPTTARTLWNRGVRTLRDLQRWYDAPVDGEPGSANVEGIAGPDEDGKEGMIRAALGFREDLEIKYTREHFEKYEG